MSGFRAFLEQTTSPQIERDPSGRIHWSWFENETFYQIEYDPQRSGARRILIWHRDPGQAEDHEVVIDWEAAAGLILFLEAVLKEWFPEFRGDER